MSLLDRGRHCSKRLDRSRADVVLHTGADQTRSPERCDVPGISGLASGDIRGTGFWLRVADRIAHNDPTDGRSYCT
ncbi:hypothetical protein BX589_103362 [Paraburkholderia fungorum]|jgi:hypothetical protein|nr:hypothetical protein BX589_103362 [Paraburkholderia fungorum]